MGGDHEVVDVLVGGDHEVLVVDVLVSGDHEVVDVLVGGDHAVGLDHYRRVERSTHGDVRQHVLQSNTRTLCLSVCLSVCRSVCHDHESCTLCSVHTGRVHDHWRRQDLAQRGTKLHVNYLSEIQ